VTDLECPLTRVTREVTLGTEVLASHPLQLLTSVIVGDGVDKEF
jgi:hypothetical protein